MSAFDERRKKLIEAAQLRLARREHHTLLKQVPAREEERTRFSRTDAPTLDQVLGTPLLLAGAQAGHLWVETSRVGRGRYVTQLFTHFGATLPFRTWRSSSFESATARHDAALAEART